MCLCFGFDGLFCFYGMLLGVWGNTVVVLKDHPFLVSKIADCWLVGVVCGVVCCVRTV